MFILHSLTKAIDLPNNIFVTSTRRVIIIIIINISCNSFNCKLSFAILWLTNRLADFNTILTKFNLGQYSLAFSFAVQRYFSTNYLLRFLSMDLLAVFIRHRIAFFFRFISLLRYFIAFSLFQVDTF